MGYGPLVSILEELIAQRADELLGLPLVPGKAHRRQAVAGGGDKHLGPTQEQRRPYDQRDDSNPDSIDTPGGSKDEEQPDDGKEDAPDRMPRSLVPYRGNVPNGYVHFGHAGEQRFLGTILHALGGNGTEDRFRNWSLLAGGYHFSQSSSITDQSSAF